MDGPATDLPLQNLLLLALPAAERAHLLSKGHRVDLKPREILHTPDRPIEAVYFVESGLISLVVALDGGVLAEVGLIGREGAAGVSLLSGSDQAFSEAMVQGPGYAIRIRASSFRRLLDEEPGFRTLLIRYNEALLAQVMQTAACNSAHTLRQRLARWLLMAHDRTGAALPLTQEFLAMMLGAQRPSVSSVAAQLQAEGAIRYANGQIVIAERKRLKAAACGCYAAVEARYGQFFANITADVM